MWMVGDGACIVCDEPKTAATAWGCIREAPGGPPVGRCIQYDHRPSAEPLHELRVASDRPLNELSCT